MSSGGKRYGLQGRYCFLCFFRPPDERKNPDWSIRLDELLNPSFCLVSDLSFNSIKVLSHLFCLFSTRQINQGIV